MRMHKTRENSNGTFSIGKTWILDQVERVEETDPLGFIITIQKPYYWMTETPKEKFAFVSALLRVYEKFTQGKCPAVVGFEAIFRHPGQPNLRHQSPPVGTPPARDHVPVPGSHPPSTSSKASNPYASSSPDPYASSHPSKPNPYATPVPDVSASSRTTDLNALTVPRGSRRPSETSQESNQAPFAEVNKSYERRDRSRSREKESKKLNSVPVPPPHAVPAKLSRETSSSSTVRHTPSDYSLANDSNASIHSRRPQDDDAASFHSSGSGPAGVPRHLASTPAPRVGPGSSHRAIDTLPDQPESTPSLGAIPSKPNPSKHGPKLSVTTSPLATSRLENGVSMTSDISASQQKLPSRKRSGSVDNDMPPSEDLVNAAMLEIESLLTSFDWTHPKPCVARLETLLTDELEAVESDNVRALIMNDDPQMKDFITQLDNGIRQCEALDEVLTLYLVELQALADDVSFIESENRGVHVRATNERALEKELSELLDATSISTKELEVLKQESLEQIEGLYRIEESLLHVYRALRASEGLISQQNDVTAKSSMQIVQQMRRTTLAESQKFLMRLKEFVKIKFQVDEPFLTS